MLEYLCYGCVGTYYLTFCVEARMREYYEINQREPPNIEMMPEREFSRINRLDPIIEE